MPRAKIEVGALNVRLHPHPEGRYEEFLRAIYRAKRPIKLRGERMGLIRSLNTEVDRDGFIFGVLTTYLEIDVKQPWFNDNTFDVATPQDLEEIVLPKYLHPNVKSYFFALDTNAHRLYFEHYSGGNVLTHNSALKFFEGSAQTPIIANEFGDAKITIVQSRLGLKNVFSIERITRIKIYLEKDNDIWPDDFEEHLDVKNARSLTLEYKAEAGMGLEADDDIQEVAEASLELGYTEAAGYGENGHTVLSTRNFPKVAQQKFEAGLYTAIGMFRDVISGFARR